MWKAKFKCFEEYIGKHCHVLEVENLLIKIQNINHEGKDKKLNLKI